MKASAERRGGGPPRLATPHSRGSRVWPMCHGPTAHWITPGATAGAASRRTAVQCALCAVVIGYMLYLHYS